MPRLCATALLAAVCLAPPAFAQEDEERDAEGCKDHPLLSRMPGFRIQECDVRDFDSAEFKVGAERSKQFEGRKTYLHYRRKPSGKTVSELQVIRNHTAAARRAGGTVLHEDAEQATLEFRRGSATSWANVMPIDGGDGYYLYVVDGKSMKQEVVADAASLGQDIATAGRASVYGIHFDTGKAVVKPESEPALAEIGKLMANEPALKLHVVGHTDNVGGFDANLKLSKERADAVVAALTLRHKVAAARLRASGVASLAPVASNRAEEGRARNRRVELVEQ